MRRVVMDFLARVEFGQAAGVGVLATHGRPISPNAIAALECLTQRGQILLMVAST